MTLAQLCSAFVLVSLVIVLLPVKFSDLVQKFKSKCGFMRRAAHDVVKLPIEFSFILSRVFSLKVATFCSNPFEHVCLLITYSILTILYVFIFST